MSKKIKTIVSFSNVLFMSAALSSCTNISEAKQYANASKIENFFSIKSANYNYYYVINGKTSVWSRRFHDDNNCIVQILNDNMPAEISREAYLKISNKDVEGASEAYFMVKSDFAPTAEFCLFDRHGLIRIKISNNGKFNWQGSSRYYIADEKVNKQILDFALTKAEDENPIYSEELSLF